MKQEIEDVTLILFVYHNNKNEFFRIDFETRKEPSYHGCIIWKCFSESRSSMIRNFPSKSYELQPTLQ